MIKRLLIGLSTALLVVNIVVFIVGTINGLLSPASTIAAFLSAIVLVSGVVAVMFTLENT